MAKIIEQIQAQFADGKKIVELPCKDPFRLRRNLYKAARRRGLAWRFARSERSLLIVNL